MLIAQQPGGTYLFLFSSRFDSACAADLWFESLGDAQEHAAETFGIADENWQNIGDPLPNCQDDWANPARIPGRENGDPEWGRLQVFLNGSWQEVDINVPSKIPLAADSQHRIDGV